MLFVRLTILSAILCSSIFSVSSLSVFEDEPHLRVNSDWLSPPETIHHERFRRSAQSNSNITSKANHLNATQQQLIVHWVGEGSTIIIALARDLKDSKIRPRQPSSVYYSYDYGDTFQDKSYLFKLNKTNASSPVASLDKFFIHPNFNSRTVFPDATNKMVYVTEDNGGNVTGYNVNFAPSDISFHPTQPRIFLAHDKSNVSKNLYLTRDFGKTWTLLQMYVKSSYWFSDTNSDEKDLIIQRQEPDGFSVILKLTSFLSGLQSVAIGLLPEIMEMYITGPFMFASRNITVINATTTKTSQDLYIKYKAGHFIKATFDLDLPRFNFHAVDTSENRLLVAVAHSNTLCNLYSSGFISEETEEIHFSLSLERIFCYFPNVTWKDSFIHGLSETPFTDLHKVEGLRGIYIASQVHPSLGNSSAVTLEHLTTKITFDWGARWRKLNLTHQLIGDACKSENCSLHLTQKFAFWYPSSRMIPILSSKSVPGVIIATGIVGENMKGHPGVYMSRDAGVTWKQVLKDSYYFNMGDHGGIIVAAPFAKSKNSTGNITYSTDEGETWQTRQITEKPLRIYSLMTEPGENTTIFSLFGSLEGIHQWVIVKIDFTNIFSYNCTEEDYKPWSPSNPMEKKMNCVMGRKDVFKRRIAHANCYNGLNFDSPVQKDNCECDISDFSCDDGFKWDEHSEHCVRNKSHPIDHYAIPKICPPYTTYNRTKGYKKIPGDTCENGPREYLFDKLPCPIEKKKEFLLLAQKEHIVTFKLNDMIPEVLPIEGLQNVIAVEFDYQSNCLFYADIVTDIISKWCLSSGNGSKAIVDSRLNSVEGMAYDWVSKHLYFVDGVLGRIEVVRTDIEGGNRFRKTIINATISKKPRGIAVHPMAGYMFWTDWVTGNPSVSRANLDGSNPQKLFSKPIVEWPNGITVDFIAERIYWVDAREDYIASSDFFGKGFKKIIEHHAKVSHPFSVAVYKDSMYWDDWRSNAIFVADKDNGSGIEIVGSALPGLMDLKIYAHSIQEGTNACTNNTKCSHMCFGLPNGKYSCQCPDELSLVHGTTCVCPGGVELLKNGTCPSVQHTCAGNFFSCLNGNCVRKELECDGDDDCGDNSDEKICENRTVRCPRNFFRCNNGKCIPSYWRCDYDNDCPDKSDEKDCHYPACKVGQYPCDSGRCIALKWRCDGENDCRDGSDERNCTQSSTPRECLADEFTCVSKSICIPLRWKCDNEKDCPDGSDEENCNNTVCESWQIQCKNHKCVYAAWKCDGDDDCGDGSDEQNCTFPSTEAVPEIPSTINNTCVNWMFRCNNTRCIPYWWKCDQINDCGDNSDEVGCSYDTTPKITPSGVPTSSSAPCAPGEFQCVDDECIPYSWVCDGTNDCQTGDDEKNCTGTPSSCRREEFRCRRSGICIPSKHRCDGIKQCADGSDETFCTTPVPFQGCPNGFFQCDEVRCQPLHGKCDKRLDCFDGSDEENCSPSNITYQAVSLSAEKIGQDSFFVTWRVLPDNADSGRSLQFIPSIFSNDTWKNESAIDNTFHSFKYLSPAALYHVVVYVQNRTSKQIYPAAYNLSVTTLQAKPSPPQNVEAKILNSTAIEVKWSPPLSPNGLVHWYSVALSPPIPPVTKIVHGSSNSVILRYPFDERNYSVSVKAANYLYDSNPSMPVFVFPKFNRTAVSNLSVSKVTTNSITLTWNSSLSNPNFTISCTGFILYPFIESKFTNETSYTVSGLSPGVSYIFVVSPVNDTTLNHIQTVLATTAGSPFPQISNFSTTLDENSVTLNWEPLNDDRKFKYAVYYGVNVAEMCKGPRKIVDGSSYTIQNLPHCKSYTFDVGVELHGSYGPLSDSPKSLVTVMDPKAPPRDVKASLDGSTSIIRIKWRSSCDIITRPIGYRVNIIEIVSEESFQIPVSKTKERLLMKVFNNGTFGGHYNISVVTTEDGAIGSEVIDIKTPPIPPPIDVIVHKDKNRRYRVQWETDKSDAMSITGTYEVVVSKGNSIDLRSAHVYSSNSSPYFIYGLSDDEIYTIAVRLVTAKGLRSEFSPANLVSTIGDSASESMEKSEESGSGYKWPIMLILLLICGVTGFVYWKRKRSLINFKNLANSHYNTRSGSTTFSGVNGLDLEDTPDHREHFSDDEPLVIA